MFNLSSRVYDIIKQKKFRKNLYICFKLIFTLTQIRNIRKTILCSLYAAACFKMWILFRLQWLECHPRPSVPPPSLHPPALGLSKTFEMSTARLRGVTLAPSWWWYRYLNSSRRCLHPAQKLFQEFQQLS